LRFSVVAWVINLRPVAQGSERKQANINANPLFRFWQRLRLAFTDKHSKPSAGFALNGQSFNCAFNRAVELDSDFADLGESKFVAFQNCFEVVSKGNTVISTIRAESWIARLLSALYSSKESIIGKGHSFKHVLKHGRVYVCNIGTNLFDVRKLKVLVKEGNRFAFNLPRIYAFLKSRVVEFGAEKVSPPNE
jgi:hypothetical protein